jgi:fumarate reductase subunit D
MQKATPLLWLLFSAGGTLAALLYPAHVLLLGLALPLGLLEPPGHEAQRALVAHPLARLYLFAFVSLPLFHWAHRFRYTLYDGLQLKHLTPLIVVLCYGTALVGTALAAYWLFVVPE